MRPNQKHYVYMMSNKHRNVLYVGVTNNLKRRVYEHENGLDKGFSKKYNCHYLLFFEEFQSINLAIKREKEIKGWRRDKKDALIKSINPQFNFLNDKLKSM
jgi:putative endonuclease